MIDALVSILDRRRLVVALTLLLCLVGLAAWSTMPRQEDPSFVPRFGTVVVPFPGADAARVERLVLDPLREELAAVTDLREVQATARANVAVLQLRLNDDVYDTDPAWDDVRRALADAELPDRAGPAQLDDDIGDPASFVVLVYGSDDPIALRDGARTVEEALRRVAGVARIDTLGDPGAVVQITIDPGTARRLGLAPAALAELVASRNLVLPGGSLEADGRTIVLRPETELSDLSDLAATPIPLPGGAALPLSALATVELTAEEPASTTVLHDGQLAVGLAVVPLMPRDLVTFGQEVHATLDDVEASGELGSLSLHVFADQPEQVASRLAELTGSLLLGVCIVAGVLVLAMGPRLGAVVSAIVPVVALSTMGVYAMGGGVLHQISIAALVLALGLLVDNAIVVAEAVQQHLDEGHGSMEAARLAVRELATPLFTATGTTLAAFAPMLLSSGSTADFTRTVPLVVVTSLILSYVAAVAVTPLLAATLLRPRQGGAGRMERIADGLARQLIARPRTVVAGVVAVLALAGGLLPFVQQQFFPLSDQARVVVSVELPEGTHIERTRALLESLDAEVAPLEGVDHHTSFIGRGPPRFYYNLNDVPSAPHAATLVLTLSGKEHVVPVLEEVRALAATVPDALVVAKRLQQGPPVGAPVEVRLQGDDLSELQRVADDVARVLRDVPGTLDVRTTSGLGVPQLSMAIDDAAATRRGASRTDVALALLGETRGIDAGTWTGSWDDVPVRVRGTGGEATDPARLDALALPGTRVPLGQVATSDLVWGPAAITRRDGVREVRVLAELADGATFSAVQADAEPLLGPVDRPGIERSWGGESEGSPEANAALLATVPVGLGLLVFFLLLEFDSIRRAGLVLLTVPLAATGVVPGLALSGAPFGFMSLLGVIALTGIVVNNAIVLIDRIDRAREEGMGVPAAVQDAVRVRLRPILLTTATTVSGMVPLAFSGSSLWPPLAWAMISGLLASTLLTVLAVPALYLLWFGGEPMRGTTGPADPHDSASMGPLLRATPSALVLLLLVLAPAAQAETLTLDEVLAAAAAAPLSLAPSATADAARHDSRAAWLSATGPAVGATLTTVERDGPVEVDTPFGPIPQQPESQLDASAEASLPLLRAQGWAEASAATAASKAARDQAERGIQDQQRQAAALVFDLWALDAQRDAAQAFADSLKAVSARLQEQEDQGLVVPADRLRAEVAFLGADQDVFALDQQRQVLQLQLGALLGRDGPIEVTASTTEAPSPSGIDRLDLAAIDHQLDALSRQRTAVALGFVPELDLYGRVVTSDNDVLVDDTWLEGGLRATWTPLARGTRVPRLASLSAQRRAATQQRRALELQVGVDLARAEAGLRTAERGVDVRRRALEQATQAAQVIDDRYAQGLATLTDLLQVQAERRRALAALRVAQVDVQRQQIEERWARGVL